MYFGLVNYKPFYDLGTGYFVCHFCLSESVFFHLKFLGYTAGFYPLYNDIYLHISSQSVGCKALLLPDSTVQNPRLDYTCSLVLHGHDKQADAVGFYLYDRKVTVEEKIRPGYFLDIFHRESLILTEAFSSFLSCYMIAQSCGF